MMNVWLRFIVGVVLGATSLSMAAKLPPLPVWNDLDKTRIKEGEMVVGMALLTAAGPKKEDDTPEREQEVEVIIEAVDAKPSLDLHKRLEENSNISGVHLEHYFGKKPEGYLVDPQQILSMQERIDFKYALDLHMEESELPIYVYLFDAAQKVPEGYLPQKVYDTVFKENKDPIVIVYYYIGAPERSDFLLAGGVSDRVPEWQVKELLWNAAHKAREKSDVFDQLDGFVGQLSMRLFWVEEILREMIVESVTSIVGQQSPSNSKTDKLVGMLDSAAEVEVPPLVYWVAGGVLLVGIAGVWFLRRKLYFPECPSPCRIGGEVGAKSGGVLSYRNRHKPPSMQREQLGKDFF
ncbi:hypothetical protein BSZ32_04360 [Rubritalea profundi]|uniref:TPM domain-containing protein n=2 Tax=Rubritalea profundi TaxID=1658618 RepID=A0A2S7TYH0_9BACT|nr:hypothetical protein BSZ32_04360 [Rubritalea profundi]